MYDMYHWDRSAPATEDTEASRTHASHQAATGRQARGQSPGIPLLVAACSSYGPGPVTSGARTGVMPHGAASTRRG